MRGLSQCAICNQCRSKYFGCLQQECPELSVDNHWAVVGGSCASPLYHLGGAAGGINDGYRYTVAGIATFAKACGARFSFGWLIEDESIGGGGDKRVVDCGARCIGCQVNEAWTGIERCQGTSVGKLGKQSEKNGDGKHDDDIGWYVEELM